MAGVRTSVYLTEELAAEVKASGVPLAELVRRGLPGRPVAGLPDGYVPPSAAINPPPVPPGARGMYFDPAQVPVTLMEPSMEAGQPPGPRKCKHLNMRMSKGVCPDCHDWVTSKR